MCTKVVCNRRMIGRRAENGCHIRLYRSLGSNRHYSHGRFHPNLMKLDVSDASLGKSIHYIGKLSFVIPNLKNLDISSLYKDPKEEDIELIKRIIIHSNLEILNIKCNRIHSKNERKFAKLMRFNSSLMASVCYIKGTNREMSKLIVKRNQSNKVCKSQRLFDYLYKMLIV